MAYLDVVGRFRRAQAFGGMFKAALEEGGTRRAEELGQLAVVAPEEGPAEAGARHRAGAAFEEQHQVLGPDARVDHRVLVDGGQLAGVRHLTQRADAVALNLWFISL